MLGLGERFPVSASISSSSNERISISAPNSRAIIAAVSVSSVELMVSIIRFEASSGTSPLHLELVGEVLDRHALGQRDELRDGRRRDRRLLLLDGLQAIAIALALALTLPARRAAGRCCGLMRPVRAQASTARARRREPRSGAAAAPPER